MAETTEGKLLKEVVKGDKNAQYSLAHHYQIGIRLGFDFENVEGKDADVYWYHKAAEQGQKEAQYTLGQYYRFGHGVKRDSKKARYWFGKAAELGHERALKKLNNDEKLLNQLKQRI